MAGLQRVITCAETDQIVMAQLLFCMAPAGLGAIEDLTYFGPAVAECLARREVEL